MATAAAAVWCCIANKRAYYNITHDIVDRDRKQTGVFSIGGQKLFVYVYLEPQNRARFGYAESDLGQRSG